MCRRRASSNTSEGRWSATDAMRSDDLDSYCLGVPNKEFRLAVARPFLAGKINVGVNMMIARGYTGQTVENFARTISPAMRDLCRCRKIRLRKSSECASLRTRA